MLDNLKRELKELIGASRHDEIFARMKEVLRPDSALYNDVVLIQASFNDSDRAALLQLVDPETQQISFNRVNLALIRYVDKITENDLKTPPPPPVALPAFHAHTCDRVEQNDEFQLVYYTGEPQKIRFFFLYGDAKQGHASLFQRLGYEIGGHLLNWESGDYNPGNAPRFFECKPQVHANPVLCQINIIRELLAKFVPQVNSMQPIQQRKMNEVLKSPHLQGMGSNDLVFILLTIDDHNWNEKITPAVVKSLIEGFCNCEMPAEAPSFFFFFGIEYRRENETVKQQVRRAIEQREHGEDLAELTPVGLNWVDEWFSRYDVLIPAGKTSADMPALLFGPNVQQLDMIDIETTLKKIIDDHNKGLVLRAENFK